MFTAFILITLFVALVVAITNGNNLRRANAALRSDVNAGIFSEQRLRAAIRHLVEAQLIGNTNDGYFVEVGGFNTLTQKAQLCYMIERTKSMISGMKGMSIISDLDEDWTALDNTDTAIDNAEASLEFMLQSFETLLRAEFEDGLKEFFAAIDAATPTQAEVDADALVLETPIETVS